jgi:hypothetical protein
VRSVLESSDRLRSDPTLHGVVLNFSKECLIDHPVVTSMPLNSQPLSSRRMREMLPHYAREVSFISRAWQRKDSRYDR